MTKPIKEYLANLIPEDQRWKVTLFQRWDTIMGPLKDKVSIAQISGDTLLLTVVHPAWAQELHLLSSMLKQKINSCFETPRIKTIRFVTSDIKIVRPNIITRPRKTYIERDVKLSSREEVILSTVQDQELKEVLADFFVRCKRMRT